MRQKIEHDASSLSMHWSNERENASPKVRPFNRNSTFYFAFNASLSLLLEEEENENCAFSVVWWIHLNCGRFHFRSNITRFRFLVRGEGDGCWCIGALCCANVYLRAKKLSQKLHKVICRAIGIFIHIISSWKPRALHSFFFVHFVEFLLLLAISSFYLKRHFLLVWCNRFLWYFRCGCVLTEHNGMINEWAHIIFFFSYFVSFCILQMVELYAKLLRYCAVCLPIDFNETL